MNEKKFDILNKIIHSKRQTDNLLEQQILDYEHSIEAFDSDLQMENDEINKNGLNIKKKINNKNQMKKEDSINEKIINGLNNELPTQQKKISSISVNIKKISKKLKQNNNHDFKKYKNESKNNSKKFLNYMGKIKSKNIDSKSIDCNNIERNNYLDKDYFSDNDYKEISGKKFNRIHNKSIDYNIDESNLDNNIKVYNRVNIYQRLFDIKIKKYENLKKKTKNGKKKFISTSNLKGNSKKVSSTQEVISEDELLQSKTDKKKVCRIKKINKNKVDIFINKNHNQNKKFLEDDIISNKSKKSGVKRQNSINSCKSNNSTEKFLQTYEKFKEIQQKKKEKIDYLRKIKEDKEKNNCYFSPKISELSKGLKEDFYTRQKKKIEEQKKKNEELRIYLQKKKEEEINRNNIMLKKRTTQKKFKMSEVNKKINELYEWETKRKEKISEKQRSLDESRNKENIFIPTIDENSKKIANIKLLKYIYELPYDNLKITKNDTLIERLYKYDVLKRKERKKILNDIYTPTFTPNLTKCINKRSSSKNSRLSSKKKKFKYNSINYNDEERTLDNIFKNYSIEKEKNNSKYSSFYHNNSNNGSFADIIRERLFKKLDRKRNNSAINLMKINENKSEENSNDTEKNIKNNSKDILNINVKTIINKKEQRKNTKIRIRVKIKDIFENHRNKKEYLLNEENKNKNNVNRSIDF